MRHPLKLMVLPFLLILLLSLACNMPGIVSSTPSLPGIPSSPLQETQAEQSPVNQPVNSNANAASITITEAELTKIANDALASQPQAPIENVQVQLQDSTILLSGTAKQGNLSVPVKINLSMAPDPQGRLSAKVDSASLGILPMPQALTDQLQTIADDMVETYLTPQLETLFVESVTISDGVITITGHDR